MNRRFFVPSIDSMEATLEGSEAHHLTRVLRAGVGTEVVLFDGSGAEYRARVSSVERARVRLTVLGRQEVDRELAVELTLAVALPKGDRQRWLVEKAVELGVSRLVPIETERGVAQPGDAALQRLRRAVIEATKQCGRNRLMEIGPATGFVSLAESMPVGAARWLAHPGGEPLADALPTGQQQAASPSSLCMAVGPEGGFTEKEVGAAAERGWRIVDLGPRTLRIETAAVALAAVVALG